MKANFASWLDAYPLNSPFLEGKSLSLEIHIIVKM
jgi:hypothetical protein